MLKAILSKLSTHRPACVDEEETPRYPPFMKGLPASSTGKLLATQSELIARLRQAVGVNDTVFDGIYLPLIKRYAAYVHLLPASESHHHRGAGGLLRHGLEVALWAIQGADRVMFAMGEPPARRRELEPRWRCGVFLAALAHDAGKPLSDVRVVDESGQHEWSGQGEDLAAWLTRAGTRRYFLRWRARRHQRHESLTPLVLPHLIPPATLGYLQAAGPELYEQILFAISARDFQARDQEHNPIFKLVREADQASVRKDIGDPVAAGMPGALGVPLERYVMDAMRRLVRERKWACNKPGARLWTMEGNLFVVWPAGAEDIVRTLAHDKAPGIPRHPDSLADVLLDRGLAVAFEEAGMRTRLWPIQPEPLRERNPGVVLHALRLDASASVFDEQPASVGGLLGLALLERLEDRGQGDAASQSDAATAARTETDVPSEPSVESSAESPNEPNSEPAKPEQAQHKTQRAPERGRSEQSAVRSESDAQGTAPTASTATSNTNHKPPQTKTPNENPHNPQRTPRDNSPRQQSRPKTTEADDADKPANPTPKRGKALKTRQGEASATVGTRARSPSADTQAEAAEAHTWLARHGHAGAVIAALAEDFRDGAKRFGEHGVRLHDGAIAIRHPEGWSGAGVSGKDMLALLAEAGWVALDPFAPMKRVREIEGFTGLKGESRRPAVVLTETPSAHFTAITEQAGQTPAASPSQPSTAPADKARTGGGKKPPARPPAPSMPSGEALVATLHDIVSPEGMGLPHRRSGGHIHIPHAEAVAALTEHLGVSASRSRKALAALVTNDNGGEVVIPTQTGE